MIDILKNLINKKKRLIKKFSITEKNGDNPVILENFDDVSPIYQSQLLNGIHAKKFYRCVGVQFSPLFDEIRNNPNSSYVTYLNDLILSTQDYTPTRVSAMFKCLSDARMHDNTASANKEILSSRIANFMGVPTVYNCSLDRSSKQDILSVDYIKYGERILDLSGTLENIRPEGVDDGYIDVLFGHGNLDKMMQLFRNVLDFYKNYFNVDRQKLLTDFAREFVTRVHILGDGDFGFHNFEMTCDQSKTIKLSPMFDYEATFSCSNQDEIANNIRYIKKNLTDFDLEKFNQRFAELVRPENFKKLSAGLDPKFCKSAFEFLKNQQSVFDSYTKYLDPENVKDL